MNVSARTAILATPVQFVKIESEAMIACASMGTRKLLMSAYVG